MTPQRTLSILLWLTLATALHAQPVFDMELAVRDVQQTQELRHATIGISVYEASTSTRLYGYNDQRAVTPASLQKLLTTGAGFARLGTSFRFTTRLLMQGEVDREGVLHGDLYIVGGGDPLLGSYRYRQTTADTLFAQWTSALRSRGVTRIDGCIRYVTSIFDGQQLHDSWQYGDVGNYYGAGALGLNFHENMYFVHFGAGTSEGDPARVVRTVPKNLSLVETNHVTTGPVGSGDRVVVYGLPNSHERLYTGTVPLGSRDFGIRAAMPEPARTCADLLATYLRTHGISVSLGAEPAAQAPDSVRTVSEYYSPTYSQIAYYTNQTSNNVYAEAIFKYLGYNHSGQGNFDGGSRAMADYLNGLGLDTSGLCIADGSGLSRLDRVTADFLGRYLSALSREDWFEEFLPTLRTGDNPAVHYKTGSMKGVKGQAGYIRSRGRWLAYAVVVNGADSDSATLATAIDSIVDAIGKYF